MESLIENKTSASLVGRVSSLLERYCWYIATVIILGTFFVGIGQSAEKLFSYDEYVTYRIANLGPAKQIWKFFADGLDTTGPLSALVVHSTLKLPFSPEISARIPSMLAFLAMSFGIFAFLRRRYSAAFALPALLLPLEIPMLAYFLTEARAYSFMLAGTGLALFFWQLSNEHKGRPWSVCGLWIALSVAVFAHFFAILLIIPFAVAQLVNDLGHKKLDFPVWLAILSYPVGWLPLLPGTLSAHRYYGAQFWAKPNPHEILDPFQAYIGSSWTLAMVLIGFVLALAVWQSQSRSSLTPGTKTGLLTAEWVLGLALLFLPLYGWAASLLFGVYQVKYMAAFSIGLVICLVAGIAELSRRNSAVGLAFVFLAFTLTIFDDNGAKLSSGVTTLFDNTNSHRELQARLATRSWIQELLSSSLPVVVDNDTYRILDFYSAPELASRVYALTDFSGSEAHPRAMTDQTNLVLFSSKMPIRSMDVNSFVQQHPEFLIVVPRNHRHYEWVPEYLLSRQQKAGDMSIRLLHFDNDDSMEVHSMAIYDVQKITR